MSSTKLFIGGLPNDCSHGDVEQILSVANWSEEIIKACEIHLVRDKVTDTFKGFAYVDVKSEERVIEMLEFDGAQFDGRRLRIDRATPKGDKKKSGRGGNSEGTRGDFRRGGGSDSTRGRDGNGRGGFRDRQGRRNSDRRDSNEFRKSENEAPDDKPQRPRLQLVPMTTDPVALAEKKKREEEELAARRAKLFQA